jgi:hypothetical protein
MCARTQKLQWFYNKFELTKKNAKLPVDQCCSLTAPLFQRHAVFCATQAALCAAQAALTIFVLLKQTLQTKGRPQECNGRHVCACGCLV